VTDSPKKDDAAVAAADADRNAVTARRGEDLAAADATVRGGGPNPHASDVDYPVALSREEQEANAAEARLAASRNMTGTEDGVSSVLPSAGGVTNMALTPAEVQAGLDDGAVDTRGRLIGTYLDDEQARVAHERRRMVENAGSLDGEDAEMRKAAAERVRSLAASPATAASDMGKAPDEQARVHTGRLTGKQDDANKGTRRASEAAANERSSGTGSKR